MVYDILAIMLVYLINNKIKYFKCAVFRFRNDYKYWKNPWLKYSILFFLT